MSDKQILEVLKIPEGTAQETQRSLGKTRSQAGLMNQVRGKPSKK